MNKQQQERTYQFNKAYDKVTEAQARLSFLLEAAPLKYTDESFSTEGLSGMTWMISDLVDSLSAAQKIMKRLAKEPEAPA